MSDVYRVSPPWLKLTTMKRYYTVQKRVAPRKWMNCCEGDKPLFFRSEANARAFIKELEERT